MPNEELERVFRSYHDKHCRRRFLGSRTNWLEGQLAYAYVVEHPNRTTCTHTFSVQEARKMIAEKVHA